MAETNLQQLLEEQDQIMALPDENPNEYVRRVETIWRPQRGKRWSEMHREEQTHSQSPAGSNHPPTHRSSSLNPEKEPILQAMAMDLRSAPVFPTCQSEPQASSEAKQVRGGSSKKESGMPIDVDDLDDFSRQVPTSPVDPGEVQSLVGFKGTRKRVSSPGVYPSKKLRMSRDASAGEDKSITESISQSPPVKVKPAGRVKRPVVGKVPQLQFAPMSVKPALEKGKNAANASSRAQSEDPSSPIEEPSTIPPRPIDEPHSRRIASEPSKLLLEVQDRVAHHRSSKQPQRLKTIPLGKQETAIETAGSALDESSIFSVASSSREGSAAPQEAKPQKDKKKFVDPLLEKRKLKAAASSKNKKEKMTPPEYAVFIQSDPAEGSKPLKKASTFLEGYNIFYTGGDLTTATEATKNRMGLIVRHGGTLIPKYDPSVVTHIVTDTSRIPTLRALGLKKLEDIPDHIPTIKWTWVTTGMARANSWPKADIDEKLLNDLWRHGAFSTRLEAGMNIKKRSGSLKGKAKEKSIAIDVEEGSSNISEFTQERAGPTEHHSTPQANVTPDEVMNNDSVGGAFPSPPSSPQPQPRDAIASSSKNAFNEDPLVEFYEQAKEEQAREKHQLYSEAENDSDSEQVFPVIEKKNRGWTCDNKQAAIADCPNQDIIDKLTELMELHKAKPTDDDHWRAFTYSKIIRTLRQYPRRITSYEEAKAIPNIGDKSAKKIAEILETGELRRIKYETTADVQVVRIFQGIYGVGQPTAYKWYNAGCRTLEDIRNRKGGIKLSSVQQTGLEFYDDINDRMPREEVKAIFELIKPIALSLDPKLNVDVMGSYRRGKSTCGDIDVLITRPTSDGKTHADILSRLLHELHAAGILTEDLANPEDPHDLEGIYRGLCRLPNVPNSKRRRIDILTIPYHSRGAALIYYTGDDIFNRAMRLKANKAGYSLNQRGLFGNVVRDPRDRRIKLHGGELIASETEAEIFKILNVPWQEPHQRVRG